MNQGKFVLAAALILFIIATVYLVYRTSSQNKHSEKPYSMVDYNYEKDSLTKKQIEGKVLFQQDCASCHSIFKNQTGPALLDIDQRWPDRRKLYQFIRHPMPLLNKDPYLIKLKEEYGNITHLAFPALSDGSIESILNYIEEESKAQSLPIQ
jgi:hypothetical protein